MYFKIKELSSQGVKVHLHCFEYGRAYSTQLADLCESVNYYKRKHGLKYLLSPYPYIAITRSSEELMLNLMKDNFPILFEGLHCCFPVEDKRLAGRKIFIRSHNIEHDYYSNLAKVEKNFWKRLYFTRESRKLKQFESVMKRADAIFAISPADVKYFEKKFEHVVLVSAFHPDEKITQGDVDGGFAFYHGNLEIGENIAAAIFLINKVFNGIHVPLIIAGNNPPAQLFELVKRFKNIQIKANITTEEIYSLVKEAHINILPTFQGTGIKLKLLASLFNGRHCLVNPLMVEGTGLEPLCIIRESAADLKKEVINLHQKLFNEKDEIAKREKILYKFFSNKLNAKRMIDFL